jgi:hypothetical protein
VNAVRVVLIIVDAVVAVTAVGGGIVLAAGLEGGRFPARWLKGTPFSSYLVPGLILAVVGAARRFPSRLPGDARGPGGGRGGGGRSGGCQGIGASIAHRLRADGAGTEDDEDYEDP